ncbi:MAG: hypothetical protein KGI97_05200 [Alphaproteobacteria bacterium]|nr:hypothetical protein [Alphaproteobacteria bacterium]
MTGTYGTKTYPQSRRMYSTPYPCYQQRLLPSEEAKSIAIFKDALAEIGENLIGAPFNYCFDMDKFLAPYFSPSMHNEDTVIAFSGTKAYQAYKSTLSPEGREALDFITTHIAAHKASKTYGTPSQDNVIPINHKHPYDTQKLAKAFKNLWKDDILLDPRLTQAEEFFFCAPQSTDPAKDNRMLPYTDEDRYRASLEWMIAPKNAQQIALMFLYSRLAQHYGETDSRSLKIAKNVAALIENGKENDVIDTLMHSPRRYWLQAQAAGKGALHLFRLAFTILAAPKIRKPVGLALSAANMIKDYKRLRDGSWATNQLATTASRRPGPATELKTAGPTS